MITSHPTYTPSSQIANHFRPANLHGHDGLLQDSRTTTYPSSSIHVEIWSCWYVLIIIVINIKHPVIINVYIWVLIVCLLRTTIVKKKVLFLEQKRGGKGRWEIFLSDGGMVYGIYTRRRLVGWWWWWWWWWNDGVVKWRRSRGSKVEKWWCVAALCEHSTGVKGFDVCELYEYLHLLSRIPREGPGWCLISHHVPTAAREASCNAVCEAMVCMYINFAA